MTAAQYSAKKRAFGEVWTLLMICLNTEARLSGNSEIRQEAGALVKRLRAKRPELAPKKPKSSHENRSAQK